MFFDFQYLLFMLPAMIVAGLAALYTHTTFSKYSKRRSASGYTGAEAAQKLLASQGVNDVTIESVQGFLSDHYDPSSKTLRLSPSVYGSDSLSAIGVACHEAGHALQHAGRYAPLMLRSAMVPAAQIGSWGSYIVLMLGFILGSLSFVKLGILLFSLTVVFSIITLPVEWNATARAKVLMTKAGVVSYDERLEAGKVLNAAFLTYVAAVFTSLMTLLYYLMRAGLLGGRRDD
jgi:Zn-dependent membrane protease YugP